jgi:nucleotide-binding universal stress UspA family protein
MNVLLAIDDSTCSEAAVAAVGRQFRPGSTTVRVLNVLQWPRDIPAAFAFAEGPGAADSVLGAQEEVRRRAGDLVMSAVSRLQAAQLDAAPFVGEGDVRQVILDMAAAWPADVIVVGSHGRKGLDRLLLGSVSSGVIGAAPCSVQVVREREGTGETVDQIAS